jgi:hypothetical protein
MGVREVGDCYPTLRAMKLREEWGTLCVAGAGEKQKQWQLQILTAPQVTKNVTCFAQDDKQ